MPRESDHEAGLPAKKIIGTPENQACNNSNDSRMLPVFQGFWNESVVP